MNVLIIGRGRVGRGLHRSLRRSRIQVRLVGVTAAPRSVRKAEVIVLAVSDDAIHSVAARIAPHLQMPATVLHCAGARGPGELEPCRTRGAQVGIMHPLVSFPSKSSSPTLSDTTFTLSGASAAIAAGKEIARACGARAIVAKTGDPTYHAAAALAANGAAAIAFVSVSALVRLGFQKRAAERAIGGLLRTVGENVQKVGVPDALTGPIARGDAETVAKHRRALRRTSRPALAAYEAALPIIVRCARAAGLSRTSAAKILDTTKR